MLLLTRQYVSQQKDISQIENEHHVQYLQHAVVNPIDLAREIKRASVIIDLWKETVPPGKVTKGTVPPDFLTPTCL